MSDKKRNAWLDLPSDDDSDADGGYDSENADQKPALRAVKRRKVASPAGFDEDSESDGVLGDVNADDASIGDEEEGENLNDAASRRQSLQEQSRAPPDTRDPTKARTAEGPGKGKDKHKKKKKDPPKPGVIYISRVPPFMKPSTLRSLLAPAAPKHGLLRIFLTPEPPAAHAARVRAGGNKKRSFADGWVEFGSRKEARRAVDALNAAPVGGRRGGWYRDDVWNMRYLSGFGWADLMAQAQGEAAERAGRGRAEAAQAAREGAAFVASVERARALNGMESKRQAKRERDGVVADEHTAPKAPRATFRQSVVKDKRAGTGKEQKQDSAVERVLGSIF